MGILIACEENKAKLPYRFKVTGTGIYTAEELSYYIYHNMLLLTDELYEEAFLSWLEKELCLREKAERIRELKTKLSGYDALLEAALVLLSGGCYYTEEEVENFLLKQSERKNISPTEMASKKAESFLQHGRYFEAGMIYESLLAGDASCVLLKEEAGRIRHNLGICRLHTEGFKRAAGDFKTAYEMTGREESKRQYVLCVLLSSTDGSEYIEPLKSEEEGGREGIDQAYVDRIREEIRESLIQYKSSEEYKNLTELKKAKEDGRLVDFTQGARKTIQSYKWEYRLENS